MRGKEARHLGKDRQQRGGRAGTRQRRVAKFPQEQDQRGLARLIGQLTIPAAVGIGATKGALHLKTQTQRIDLEALRQIGLQQCRGWSCWVQRQGQPHVSGKPESAQA